MPIIRLKIMNTAVTTPICRVGVAWRAFRPVSWSSGWVSESPVGVSMHEGEQDSSKHFEYGRMVGMACHTKWRLRKVCMRSAGMAQEYQIGFRREWPRARDV